jgi:serine/threonine protein kinase
MFKLLTGYRPFTDDNFSTFVDMCTELNERVKKYCDYNDYAVLFQEINFPIYISEISKDFIKKLLNVDEKKRLGSGPNGVKEIKQHPFFNGIDWEALELKHLIPPYIPDRTKFFEDLVPHDFETAMTFYNKKD